MDHSQLHILIVEDNRVNQLLVKNMLAKFGFSNFDMAENGEAALQKLSENKYDIILLDIQMPGMDGFKITNEIRRKNSKHGSVPIIALTGNGSEKDRRKAIDAGINDYMVKPYTPEDLFSTILKYLDVADQKVDTSKKARPRSKKEKTNNRNGVNLDFLEKYTGGDLKITTQLLEIFLRDVPDAMEKLEKFIGEKKWKDVHAVSHKVKSNFAIFELSDLKNLTVEIEECSRELINLEDIPELFEKFNSGCLKVLPHLEKELKKLKES